jgi:hypothetical protein
MPIPISALMAGVSKGVSLLNGVKGMFGGGGPKGLILDAVKQQIATAQASGDIKKAVSNSSSTSAIGKAAQSESNKFLGFGKSTFQKYWGYFIGVPIGVAAIVIVLMKTVFNKNGSKKRRR